MSTRKSSGTKRAVTRTHIRLWPFLLVLAMMIVAITAIWLQDLPTREAKFFLTVAVVALTALLVLIWLLFFSKMTTRQRLIFASLLIASAVLVSTQLQTKGLSGDAFPVLTWRFMHSSAIALRDVEVSASRLIPDSTDVATFLDGYPQFLGPRRNGVIKDVQLETDWKEHPPRLIWRQPVGEGWSAFAVAGPYAVTQEQRGEQELVVCYNVRTGNVHWVHSDEVERRVFGSGGPGPRATPTLSGSLVLTLGATGILNCLELATGKRLWMVNIIEDNDATINYWGMSGSPLVVDSLVVVTASGANGHSLFAYHMRSGQRVWSAGKSPTGYSSPQLNHVGGVPQILIFNKGSVSGHALNSGDILWHHPWQQSGTSHVAQPVVLPQGRVFVSSGYGVGCELLKIKMSENEVLVSSLWKNRNLKSKFANVIYHKEYLYGLDNGILTCLDAATGERAWKRGRYGHGQLLLIGNTILIQTESGDIALVQASPDAFVELARWQALGSKTWNHPAFARPLLIVRNDLEAACYELSIRSGGN